MSLDSFAWLAVFPALGFLIVIHEIGHYWVGRKMGIKIEEFGIGFPPRAKVLFTRKGVPFTLNWLPLGGFVRFAGEESGFDDPDSLLSASPGRRIPVLAAGVIANVLVAMALFAIIFSIWGYPQVVPGHTEIGTLYENAERAGLKVNDRIVSINGQPITEPAQVKPIVQQSKGQPVAVAIERDGQPQTISVTPQLDDKGDYLIGVGVSPKVENTRINPFQALWRGITHSFVLLVEMFTGFATLLGSLFGLAAAPDGGLAGPVGIARITGAAARNGLRDYLQLTAVLSLNLALINILPIPALDGSRIVFALVEAVRRKKIAPEREAFVHAVGMTVLLGLMLLITVSDVSNVINDKPPISGGDAPTVVTTPTP
ncbi:MAG TPA: RIP metalloprotease RseP [Herpetosiphonaceae bacterium]